MRGRVHQPVGKLGVVGHQQQAFARLVEAADRRDEGQVEPFEAGIDGVALLRVVAGGDQPARLVEHEIDLALGNHRPVVDDDAVAVEVDAQGCIAHHLAADAHAAFRDQHLGLRARAQAELRQRAVQADAGRACRRVACCWAVFRRVVVLPCCCGSVRCVRQMPRAVTASQDVRG
jgi:hypothetical protein